MEDKYQNNKASTSYLLDLLKTVALSLTVTFIILFIAAMLLCFTDFPELYTLPSAVAATILGVFAGSTMAARKNPNRSLMSSLLTASVYSVLAYIIGCILQGKVVFTLNTALFMAISLMTGAIASIMVNRRKNPNKYSGTGSTNFADRFKKKKSAKTYSFNRTGR